MTLDDTNTTALTITNTANSGVTVGNISSAAALRSLTVTAAATSRDVLGTIETATALETISLSATGAGSVIAGNTAGTALTGAIGATTNAPLTSVLLSADTGVVRAGSISGSGANTVASIGLSVSNRGTLDFGTITTKANVTALTISVGASSTLAAGGIIETNTAKTLAATTITVGDDAVIGDGTDTDVTLVAATGQPTISSLVMSIGNRVTFTDKFDLSDALVTAGTITLNAGSAAINYNQAAGNTLQIGGTAAATLTAAGYTAMRLIQSGSGAVVWTGGNGTNRISGGVGADSITGGTGADTLDGGAGDDTLLGGGGADSIFGGAGNDSITGGAGADSIDGGGGVDRLVISATGETFSGAVVDGTTVLSATIDRVTGFGFGDTISLAALSNTFATLGTTIASATGTTVALIRGNYAADGKFTASATGADTLVYYDNNATGADSMEAIVLIGYASSGSTIAAGVITLGGGI